LIAAVTTQAVGTRPTHVATRVRTATAADTDWLVQCAVAMARETEDKALDAGTVRAGIGRGIAEPQRARYFVAMQDAHAGGDTLGRPVGTLMLTTEWSDWRNGDWWWIQSVYVVPEARRQGVYTALYAYVQALARDTPGVVGLRLYVEDANATAQRTYGALGMADAGYRILEDPFKRDRP
jgi:GNAT superfamily N-acetyltransferase